MATINTGPKARRIQYAAFQSAITAPGVLDGATSSVSETTKTKGIEIYLEPGLLVIHFKNREILVPTANIKSMIVAQE